MNEEIKKYLSMKLLWIPYLHIDEFGKQTLKYKQPERLNPKTSKEDAIV